MKIEVDVGKKRGEDGTSCPIRHLHLDRVWPGIVTNRVVMVFVKQVVMSIA
jgi:hypothetical protein